MTRIERKLLVQSSLIGTGLTLFVMVVYLLGGLAPMERLLYDRRARDCQYFTPAPTDRLVHLDIDDRTLEAVGRWPWPRSELAHIVDELRLAGARTIAFDIILPDADPGHDEVLATAIARHGGVLIPIHFDVEKPKKTSAAVEALADALYENVELGVTEANALLVRKGFTVDELTEQTDDNQFIVTRRDAMLRRIWREFDREVTGCSSNELRNRVLPHTDTSLTGSALLRLMESQCHKVESLWQLQRFSRPVDDNLPSMVPMIASNPPPAMLLAQAGATGFVNYIPGEDGVVRTLPLWVEYDNRMYPQLSFALATLMLGADPRELRVGDDHIVVPRPNGDRTIIPMHQSRMKALDRRVGMLVDLPWFGAKGDWLNMYGPNGAQHLPLVKVWEMHKTRTRIKTNSVTTDSAVKAIYGVTGDLDRLLVLQIDSASESVSVARIEASLRKQVVGEPLRNLFQNRESALTKHAQVSIDEAYPDGRWLITDQETEYDVIKEHDENGNDVLRVFSTLIALDQIEPRIELIDTVLGDENVKWIMDQYTQMTKSQLEESLEDPTTKAFLDASKALRAVRQPLIDLKEQLHTGRESLRQTFEGRAVLIGSTSTGAPDFKSTSLHASCPGVVVHGVLFNAIMTDHFLKRAPRLNSLAVLVGMGIMATCVAALFTPFYALLISILLGGAYWLVNGLILYDYGNMIMDIAGPIVVLLIVWSGCTVARFVVERRERARITRRFSNYVDPALVNYVIEHPEQARLDGQVRELTVVFTDLAGFTTLSEKLKERTVPLLNDYMGRMVPIIRKYHGYVNKFLGDGMMFFFGAPLENPSHAVDAVNSVLEMQQVMIPFNEELKRDGLPVVNMRVGVSSGEMVVGDAGSADASDYTVLGDTVNLSARLESANKATGTLIMMNDRTAELIGDRYLLRPIGRLQVIGKTEGVMVYEPLSAAGSATRKQERVVELSSEIFDRYVAARFEDCLAKIEAMEKELGTHKWTDLYRQQCQHHIANPPVNGFHGNIVLTSK